MSARRSETGNPVADDGAGRKSFQIESYAAGTLKDDDSTDDFFASQNAQILAVAGAVIFGGIGIYLLLSCDVVADGVQLGTFGIVQGRGRTQNAAIRPIEAPPPPPPYCDTQSDPEHGECLNDGECESQGPDAFTCKCKAGTLMPIDR